ncbi:MAG TPA: hypothetical protein VEF34_04085 [Syntrophobacteraceae bacterium]|nr:hypothetical protein [Syntrophobacteraceae bacterium]
MNDHDPASRLLTRNGTPAPDAGEGRTVLIGFGESLSAPEVAWNLLDSGFRVAAFIRRGRRVPLRRLKDLTVVEVTAPEDGARETVDQLLRVVELLRADAVLPLDDASIWVCEAASSGLGIPVAGSSGTHARLILDKRLQLEAAEVAGFRIPETLCVPSVSEALRNDLFPIFVKPALAAAEIGGKLYQAPTCICASPQELRAFALRCRDDMPMLIQPLITGKGEGLFGQAGPNGVQAWSAHRRIRMMNPAGSGSSACRSLPIADQPTDCAETMLGRAKWQGLFMIELLRDRFNRIWFMELNGRPWGSMALALRRGFAYPAWTVMQTLDPSFSLPPCPAEEHMTCRHLGREIVHLMFILKAWNAPALMNGHSGWRAVAEVCRCNSRDHWYNWRPGNAPFFIEDTFGTVFEYILNALRRRSSS